MKSNKIPHRKSMWFSYPYVRGIINLRASHMTYCGKSSQDFPIGILCGRYVDMNCLSPH